MLAGVTVGPWTWRIMFMCGCRVSWHPYGFVGRVGCCEYHAPLREAALYRLPELRAWLP